MTTEFDYKELFSQYAVETGRYLPRRKREDIQLEIVSLLEDSLEDISETSGQQPDEETAIELLRTFGPPITYAEKYRQREYLVGPAIFPLFKPVLIFAIGLYLVQFMVGLFLPGGDGGFDILNIIDTFFDKGFQVLGVLVFAFALIERTTPESWLRWPFKEMERTWDPTGLIANKSKKVVAQREVWVEVVFLAALIIFLAIFSHWVGVGVNRNGVWSFVPTLSINYARFQPWIIAYLLAKLVFNVALARQAYWDSQMRWFDLGLRVAGIVLLFGLMFGPDMFGLNPAYMALHDPSLSLISSVEKTLPDWNTGLRIFLALQLVVQFVLAIRDLFRITRGKSNVKLNLQ